MAKRSSKGPRRPRIRAVITARPAVPPISQRHVVHVIHHQGPTVGGLRAPMGAVAPRPVPGVNTAFPRPAVGPVGAVPRPAGPFSVPQPAGGAPGAPLMGPGGGPIPPFGRRF